MFYLITFYKILLSTPFKSLIFIVMGWGIVFGLAQNKKLDKVFFKEFPDGRDYFYALISEQQNRNDISRKLQKLPGIDFIKMVSKDAIQKELIKILKHSDLGGYMDASLEQLDYHGLKVVFSSDTKMQSQELIRDYLFRLVGKEHLTLGPTQKRASAFIEGQKPFMLFKKHGVLFLMAAGTLIWILLGLSYIKFIRDNSYVIENFQRRNSVSLKITLSGMLSLFIMGFFLAWMIGDMDIKGVLLATLPFLFIILLHIRTGEWQH